MQNMSQRAAKQYRELIITVTQTTTHNLYTLTQVPYDF